MARESTDEYFALPAPDPAAFGRSSDDDATVAEMLRQRATVFPSHHGGFLGGESGYAGQPEAFARKLREILDNR